MSELPPPPPPLPPPVSGVPPDDRQLLATPTRQSPVAVVFIALRFLRNLGAVNIVVALVVLGSGRLPVGLLTFGVLACLVGLAFTVAAWWRFVFTVDGDELLVAKGVLAQERLTIPLDRVQSVSIDQRFLHRIIGLVSVSVDTAGSSEAELEIDAVDRGRAEALQRLAAGHVRAESSGGMAGLGADGDPLAGQTPEPTEETLVARSPLELIRVGITRWPWAGLAALAPIVAFADDIGDLLPLDLDGEQLIEDNLPDEFGQGLVLAVVGLVVAVVVIGTLFGALLQTLRVLVTDWDLRLTRTSTGLRRTAGLFSRTSRASTLNRIQAIQTDETPLQRVLGIRRLALPTIGQGDLVIPGATRSELGRLRSLVFGRSQGVDDAEVGPAPLDRRISRRYVFLAVRSQTVLALIATAVAVAFLGWFGLFPLATIPGRWLAARRQWRLRRWGVDAERIAESYELVNRHTAELELIKAQVVEVRRSFFERRRGLATVRITTADGYLAVPLIPLAEAEAVRDLALSRVQIDRRPWM